MKKLFSVILAMGVALAAYAQNSIKVEAPNLVAADEQFNVTFVVEGENTPSDFNWSATSDFQLVWGPQKGSSTSMSIVNGKMTKSSQVSYTYVLLPKKTGKLTIPSATAKVKGRTITSQPVVIEVASASAAASSSNQTGGSQEQSVRTQVGEVDASDLFMRLTLSKTSAVVGESISATLKLYQNVNIAGFEDARFPEFTGFWSQEVQAPTNIEFKRETLDGRIYNTAVLRSYVLIPQQSGSLTIDPAELVCLVNVRSPRASTGSIFDSFFQDDYRTIRKRVTTNPVTVRVSALPSGAPSSFCGGVGKFEISAKLSKDSLMSHDAASLIVTLSGKGNVSLLEAPKISFPPDFEVYDIKSTESTDKSNGRTSGSKTFEYPFIPRSHGDFVIGPVEYSYYDVNQGRYVTLTSDPLAIKVAKNKDSEAAASQSGSSQLVSGVNHKDVKNLDSDIRYIRTKTPVLSDRGRFFVFSGLFWVLFTLILVAGLAAYVIIKKNAALKSDVALSKNRGATKMARKRLAAAGDFLAKDLYTAFYEELHKTLLGYASDKLNMDMADMSRENIALRLFDAGASRQDADDFCSILEDCEMARYSPNTEHNAMNEQYEKAVNVISSIDSSVKGRKKGLGTIAAVLAMILTLPVNAADWDTAVNAYSRCDYQAAVTEWSEMESRGESAVDLYYNLGNAYFKLDDYAHAILYYERALRLDPTDRDVKHNLDFAREFTQDRIEDIPEVMITSWAHSFASLLGSDAWAVIMLVLLALSVCGALMYFLSGSVSRRKSGFFGGIVALVLCVITLMCSAYGRRSGLDQSMAIIMKPVVSVKSSPSSTAAKDLFVLHEGTKVQILDSVGDYQNIELSDGRQGWIKTEELEVI